MGDPLASQTVAMIQLSTEEKERYKGAHVFLDFGSGLYTFPVSFFFKKKSAVFQFYCFVGLFVLFVAFTPLPLCLWSYML